MSDRPPSAVRLVRESRRRTKITAIGVAVAALVTFLSAMILLPDLAAPPSDGPAVGPTTEVVASSVLLEDDFRDATLDPARWTPFVAGAPAANATIAAGRPGLELGLDTRGLGGHPQYVAGVVSGPLDLGAAARLRALLDWRAPRNACYRAAGVLVAREGAVPAQGPIDIDALTPAARLEVVGVPPGERARRAAWIKTGPNPRPVFTDGWPAARAGRNVGRTSLELLFDERGVSFGADGDDLGRAAVTLGPRVRVVLFALSHSNYPPRPVVFERVQLEGVPAALASSAAGAGVAAPGVTRGP